MSSVREVVPVPSRRSRWRRVAEAGFVLAFLVFIGWAVARQWSRVAAVIGELSVPALGLSGLAALAGIWCSMLCWKAILADFGGEVPLLGGMRIFFIGQAGKYVPGKVWPILTQVRIGREYQVPGRSSMAAVLVFMAIVLGAGLLVAVCTLPVLGAESFTRYWWVLAVLPLAVVGLLPPVLNRALALALKLGRREPMPRPMSFAGIGRSVAWALAMWLLYGVHLWALLADLGADAPHLLIRATGAFAGAWAIGFLLIIAPAGVGPREAALVLLLASTVAEPTALVAALVSRLLLTIGDLTWPLVAIAIARYRRLRVVAPAEAPVERVGVR